MQKLINFAKERVYLKVFSSLCGKMFLTACNSFETAFADSGHHETSV